jgi:type II secretory pathway component GspD/PulD (secretin)
MRHASFNPILSVLFQALLLYPLACKAQDKPKPEQSKTEQVGLPPADPKHAKLLIEQGKKEEAIGAFPEALQDYEAAARYAPFDVTIVAKAAALRSKLVHAYVESSERNALEGNLDAATMDLAMALHIDPSNAVVEERLQQMQSMRDGANTHRVVDEPPEGLARLEPDRKSVHSFNLRSDVKNAYEQVASAYGVKATFDPDLPARPVRFRVSDVDFDTAISILATESYTFWRPLNARLLFVAADTTEKRKAYDPQIEQTFLLPASVDSTEINDVVKAVRELTGVQHIQQSVSAHTITLRDSVARVQLASALIHQMERTRGEVLLEIDLLEVDRSLASKLGVTPPASERLISIPPTIISQVRSASSLTQLLTLLAGIFGGPLGSAATTGITSLAAAIPPIVAIGGGKSTFLLTLPSATVDFSRGLSLVRSGRQVLLRAQDQKPATFFVGDRYPITLSLLSGSLGSAGFTANPGGTPITVPSEQFTVGQGPVALVSADFRNSGNQDLAVVNELDNTLSILINQGAGAATQFLPATNSPIKLGAARTSAPDIPPALAVGTLNTKNNSFPDILVTDPVANNVTELLGNGDGTFAIQTTPIAVGKQPSSIAVGAFNTKNNTNPGFVVTNFTDNTYSVFLGNTDGTFTPVTGSPFSLPATAQGPVAVTVADFNNDGTPDLAILNQVTTNVTLLQGNGDGTFSEFTTGSPLTVGKLPVAIASGTLSGSTGPGLAIVNQQDNTLSIFLGNGNGSFVAATQSPIATNTKPSGVVIADFLQGNAGGIAVTNTGTGTVTVYADLGSGLFTPALEPPAGTNPGAIVAGDFTASAFPDVVVANNLSGTAGQVTLLQSPTSLVSNPAITQTPYPGAEYEDIGIKIKATPSLHLNNEVTLQLELEIKALAGSSVNGIPVITNRTMNQTVRVKEDETTILGGLLEKQETKTITGLPGFAQIPTIGYLFGSRANSDSDTELLILVTPRRVRLPLRQNETIYAGRGEPSGRGAGGGAGVIAPQPEPETAPVPPAGEQPGQPTPGQPAPPPNPQPPPDQPQPNPPEQPQPAPPQQH